MILTMNVENLIDITCDKEVLIRIGTPIANNQRQLNFFKHVIRKEGLKK